MSCATTRTTGWHHLTNNAGGIEGGISNGEPIVARVAVKPIPTLAHPLPSVDVRTGENVEATRYERSDVCVVPAAGVVGEAMLAHHAGRRLDREVRRRQPGRDAPQLRGLSRALARRLTPGAARRCGHRLSI